MFAGNCFGEFFIPLLPPEFRIVEGRYVSWLRNACIFDELIQGARQQCAMRLQNEMLTGRELSVK